MAGPGGGSKSVVDALTNTYTDLAKMQLLPDAAAHAQFLQKLQQAVQQYIIQQGQSTLHQQPPAGAQAGIGGPGGGPGGMMGNPGGPGAPPGMAIAPGGGAGMSGLMGAMQRAGAPAGPPG